MKIIDIRKTSCNKETKGRRERKKRRRWEKGTNEFEELDRGDEKDTGR